MKTVGDEFPPVKLKGIDKDNNFVDVEIVEGYQPLKHDWTMVVYFYPKDFTFICPTEGAGMDKLVEETILIGISGDNEFCKLVLKKENALIGDIKHTLAADCGLRLSEELGIVNDEEVFVIVQHLSLTRTESFNTYQLTHWTLEEMQTKY